MLTSTSIVLKDWLTGMTVMWCQGASEAGRERAVVCSHRSTHVAQRVTESNATPLTITVHSRPADHWLGLTGGDATLWGHFWSVIVWETTCKRYWGFYLCEEMNESQRTEIAITMLYSVYNNVGTVNSPISFFSSATQNVAHSGQWFPASRSLTGSWFAWPGCSDWSDLPAMQPRFP